MKSRSLLDNAMKVSWSDLISQQEMINEKMNRVELNEREQYLFDGLNNFIDAFLNAFELDGMVENVIAVNEDEETWWVNKPHEDSKSGEGMSDYTSGDVMDIIYSNFKGKVRRIYEATFDSDGKSGEMILTMPDGSEWVITAKEIAK